MAWCHDWAVGRKDVIYYRDKIVGKFVGGKPELKKAKQYLRERLEEVL